MKPHTHMPDELAAVQKFSVPTLANALETFHVLPSNDGFCSPELKCLFPAMGTMVGYAATVRITSDQPPSEAHQPIDEPQYWHWLDAQQGPKIVVVQDRDVPPKGAIWGEWNSHVHQALGCVGTITQGGVRDLDDVQHLGFHFFATAVLPSHAYAMFTDYGGPVCVAGLTIRTGDLLAGDRHGVILIPPEVPLAELASVSKEIERLEKEIFDFCKSPSFNLEGLAELDRSVQDRWPKPLGADQRLIRSV